MTKKEMKVQIFKHQDSNNVLRACLEYEVDPDIRALYIHKIHYNDNCIRTLRGRLKQCGTTSVKR